MLESKKIDPDEIRRVLIRSTNWVGDAIMTTPAVRAVRKNFPRAEITILAKPWVAPVFSNNPYIDRIMLYDDAGRHRLGLGTIRIAKELRHGSYDLAVLFQNAFEAALLAFLAGIPKRLGYDTDGRKPLLTHPVKRHVGFRKIHEIDYYLAILTGARLAVNGRDLTLVVSDAERQRADTLLAGNDIRARDRLVGVNPGATYGTAKRWLPDRFAELCDRLCRTCDARIVIFGAPGEKEVADRIGRLMQYPALNLCGKTNLREAMAVIELCRLFVTNDSGLMHVAAALDIPLVSVFGSTNPVTTGPSSSKSHVVRVPVPCSPCLKPECPTDHRCMKEISVDMVFSVVKEMLARGS
jgi:heptosyltransferase-2